MKSQAMAQYHGHGRHGWGSCRRVGVEGMGANLNASAPPASAGAPSAAAQRWPWYPLPHPYSMGSAPPPADGAEGIAPPPPPFSPLKAYEGWEKQQDERIAAEKAHMAKVSRQAVDTVRLPPSSFV
jgi:hypothetical protein